MRVFKFGGASVKDASAVKNVAEILKKFTGEKIIVVVSAMGKTTNALEKIVDAKFSGGNINELVEETKKYHFDIINSLFSKDHQIHNEINNVFVELEWAAEDESLIDYNHAYDQVVSLGEIISSKIVSACLNESGVKNAWKDVRDFLQTDNTYREGKVDWDLTEALIKKELLPAFKNNDIVITQGFIGGTSENFTTTLGREGSDYTAAILAYCTNANDVTIWKDVPGVLNADPKFFPGAKKIDKLSYRDAIELAYYGATVIHPKTIKPLQNKNIPLYVKSFLKPEDKGTVIKGEDSEVETPCYIFKPDQILVSILPKDFSFIAEENLGHIFKLFADLHIKVNVMQNSAISFSVSLDNDERKIPSLIEALQEDYKVLYNENLQLVTIRHYNQDVINKICGDKSVLLEQKSRTTVQLVVKD